MYQYSDQERQFLHQRASQFQGQVARFRAGALDGERFAQLRLRNGLYEQRHAHMLRVAIPYGQLNSAQLAKLAHIARKYDRGYGHFTTRQNIQYNWPELDDVPAILHELAEVDMHAIQTSGSCIRNITSDHLAGVSSDEYEDPRPWCELLRQWSTLHPEFNWLPRKFKFAVTGAKNDRAAVQFHDIGIRIVKNGNDEVRFKIYVGGGMGRTPVIGKLIHDDLPAAELLSYLQAIMRVYNKYGRRDNKYKARIKILVNALGIDKFAEKVNQAWAASKKGAPAQTPELTNQQINQAKSFFTKKLAQSAGPRNSGATLIPVANPAFMNWRKHNTSEHALPGYVVVHVSLKAQGEAPGDLDADIMERLACITRDYSADEIRVTHEQNLVLPYVKRSDLFTVWHKLNELKLATPNIGKLTDMIACPGLDFCSLANAGTIELAKEISERMDDFDRLYQIGDIKLKMSGCVNACGHHHAGHIGILGVDKKGEEWYQLTLGGSAENDARIGQRLGPAVAKTELADAIENIIETYLKQRRADESFLATVIRTGVSPFQENLYENLYANHKKSPDYQQSVAA
ncbi:nitrite/sulfite reductase [Candidatus Spongiihabitans sp.]|uniref:nitrite/sulfite reductase n=1 Tax=Candidatus Spongiihabitans sp. TaxID=3101308 RepID=UPI003C7A3BA0